MGPIDLLSEAIRSNSLGRLIVRASLLPRAYVTIRRNHPEARRLHAAISRCPACDRPRDLCSQHLWEVEVFFETGEIDPSYWTRWPRPDVDDQL